MLDLTSLVDTTGEGGLLGMAFHPQFSMNGLIYLSYTAAPVNSGAVLESRLSRFISNDDGLTLDPASEEILLRLDQPFDNHNGGAHYLRNRWNAIFWFGRWWVRW